MRRLSFSLALLGFLVPGISFALGLGEIEVESALNQPLKARIALVAASPTEMSSLRVNLASPEVFAQVGLDRPFYLTELQFEPVMKDGVASIEVTTRQSVREPFLNFLVEVSWSTGRLLREYTVLLDPPIFVEDERQVPTQAPVVAPEPAAIPAPAARPERVAPAPTTTAAPAPVAQERLPSPTPALEAQPTTAEGIVVQSGDTLWSLATRNRPDADITVEQMMMALLRANPEAFGNDNINNLKKGYVLRIPDRDEITGMTRSDAFDAVQEQHALWREYRAQLAGDAVPQQPSMEGTEPAATAEQAAGDASTSGRLDIVGAGDAAGSAEATVLAQADTAVLEEELAVARQTLEARRQENEELQARVMELEQILSDKDRLLLLKDDELAELQARLGEPVAPVTEEVVEQPPEVAAEPEEIISEPVTEEVVSEEPVTEVVSEPVLEEPAEVGVVTEEVSEPVVEEPVEPEAEQPPAPAVEPPPAPVAVEPAKQPSFFEDLTSRPNFLAIAGIGAVLVVLVVALIVRRARKSGETEELAPFEEAELGGPEEGGAAEMVGMVEATEELAAGAATAGEQPIAATGAEAEVEPVASAAAPEAGLGAAMEEEIESDDTTAEADVYLAYGLHQQAEELLKGALASNPDKNVYRLKLLETYFATKDKASFDSIAQELHDRLGDTKGLVWSRAVVMGQEISPDNPLFSGTDVSGLSASDFAPKRPESADIDLGLGEDLGPSPELDIGLEESEQPTGELPTGLDFGAAERGGEAREAAGLMDEGLEALETEAAPQAGGVEETAEIEFDLSELDVSAPEEPKQAEEPTDLNVEFGAEPETEESASPAAYESETEEIELAPTSETMELDVSDLDLTRGTQETQELEAGIEGLGAEEEEGLIAGGDEVSTKLDLAKAYIDMGDAEGARSTLEEVIAEGNEEQRREAEDLMSQIA